MFRRFELKKHNTTLSKELMAGIVTFFSMSYILFVNPTIISLMGIPFGGAFLATLLCLIIGTLGMAFYANAPYAMAPGMGVNTFITFSVSLGLGLHWKETLALVFIAGLCHCLLILTRFRKAFVKAIPHHLQYASGIAIGLFIAYIGFKNAGFLTFLSRAGSFAVSESGVAISDASIIPSFTQALGAKQIVAITGLLTSLCLLALEKKTGDHYAALLIGIVSAIFISIPLDVIHLNTVPTIDFSQLGELSDTSFAIFGDPGFVSLFKNPDKIFALLIMTSVLLMTDMIDSLNTILATGRVDGARIFSQGDLDTFLADTHANTRLDKAMLVNASGGIVAALAGSTTSVVYAESISGIAAGGRTGLTAFSVVLCCLVFSPIFILFPIIPAEVVAPALIIAGISCMSMARHIDWTNFEEAAPSALIILSVPLTFSIMDGILIGYISHVCIQLSTGKARDIHPLLVSIVAIFIALIIFRTFVGY